MKSLFVGLFLALFLSCGSNSSLQEVYISDDMFEQLDAIKASGVLSEEQFEWLYFYCDVVPEELKEGKTYATILEKADEVDKDEFKEAMKMLEELDLYNNRTTEDTE